MENDTRSNAFLENEPVGRLIRKYSVPCIISLLVGALYNIVDQLFISNADYLGSNGNAANTVVFPLTVVALAAAVMIGDGACAFISISLGRGASENARKTVGSAVVLSLAAGAVLTAVYFIFADPILTAFGGRVNEQTFAFAREYFGWISAGILFYVFGQAMNPVIRSDGSPRFAMVSTLSGAVLNIILDPVFIFPMHMGMAGAAIATIMGQALTAFLSLWYLFHMKAVKIRRGDLGLNRMVIAKILPLGMTSFLSQISMVASMAAVNNMIRRYGALDPVFGQAEYAQIPMAVIGIVMKFFQIIISVVIGMAAGCIPVVGYNVGAGRQDRTRLLFRKILTGEACVGGIALVIAEFFPQNIINLFGAANESAFYTEFAVKSFRIYLCMIVFACVNKAVFIFLQSLGKAKESTILSMTREIVFGVGFALLLPVWMGLDGVLWSMPVSDILTFVLTAVIVVRTFRQPLGGSRAVSRSSGQ